MPTSAKSTEEKMDRMLNGWRTLAPDKTFGGMTLAQFEAALASSESARQRIKDLDDQRTQAATDRDASDETSAARMQQVVNGVLADPDFGPDSALYEALGCTRQSERKSGLTRTRKQPPTSLCRRWAARAWLSWIWYSAPHIKSILSSQPDASTPTC